MFSVIKLVQFMLFPVIVISVLTGKVQAETNEVKFNALYICNFAKYVIWPDSAKEIIITVLGTDPVYDELTKIAQILKGTNELTICSVNEIDSITKTHIIFIPSKNHGSLARVVTRFENKPVLIVTNRKGALEQGAGINLNNLYWKLRYEISMKNLSKHGLTSDPLLLKLGKVIE